MNIIRAFMSQLYGLARIDAAFNNQSLKTIHSSNVISGLFFCVRGGAGGFEKKLGILNLYARRYPSWNPILDTLSPAFFGEP